MRVLHIVTSGHRRGGDVFASDLVGALHRSGVEQRVAAVRAAEGSVVSFSVPTELLSSHERRLPIVKVDLGCARAVKSIIEEWRPDIVQAHGGEPYKYAVAANRSRRTQVVYRRIGGAPEWIRHGPRRFAHAHLMRRADWIIAVAEAVRRETIDLFGVDASRIITIPNGVSQQRLRPIRGREVTRRLLDIPRDAVVVLSLGALSWEKDPMAQLMVASSVVNKHDEVVHVFVGDGPLRHSLEDRIHELGLSSRCRVLGARADVGDIFGASDVFLFASREDGMEGMPATVIEAGMAELPVASYSVMGIPEVVHHGETGLLARYGDLLQLTEHVGRLVRSQAMRRTMGRAAGRFCRSHFEIGHIAARYLDLYSTWTSDARSLSIAGTDRL